MRAQVFVWTKFPFHPGKYPEAGVLDCMVSVCFTLQETPKLFFNVCVSCCHSYQQCVRVSICLASSNRYNQIFWKKKKSLPLCEVAFYILICIFSYAYLLFIYLSSSFFYFKYWEFLKRLRYKSLMWYVICKYFFAVCGLSFSNTHFWWTNVLHFGEVKYINFSFIGSVFCIILRNPYLT